MLQSFTADRPAMTLTELAIVLGLPKAGTQRLVRTLVDLGYLHSLPGKRYGLGVMALDLGHRYLTTLNIPALAQPFMQELVAVADETVNLAILNGREVVYIARIPAAPRIVSINLEVGSRLPAHATALGKALLVDCTREQLIGLFGPEPWPQYTPHTRVTSEALLKDLVGYHQSGVVMSEGELEPGLRSLAAPIRDISGGVVAAINVSTNMHRVDRVTLLGPIRVALVKAADTISQTLGYRGWTLAH